MAAPTELAALTAELKRSVAESRFRFEWASKAQGQQLLLCGDWARNGRRTSRTLYSKEGKTFRKAKKPLSTADRLEALQAATTMTNAWLNGAETRQRGKRHEQPASTLLAMQRKVVLDRIRQRSGGHGVKQKHTRHARALFTWLDDRNQALDAPGAIHWAGLGVERNTDTYADRLRMARWACKWNSKVWVLPEEKRIKKPKVKRPFVDESTDEEVEQMFSLIKDPAAATFCRVIAATGCRPGEAAHFEWARWELEGRPQHLRGYSPKIEKEFIAICHPLKWIKNIDLTLVKVKDLEPARRPVCEVSRELATRHYSKMLRMVKKDLKANGWTRLPTWTDLRHMWTIRAEIDGYNSMIVAKAQAHSHRTAQIVYLRHGEEKQILGEIERMANIAAVAVEA